MSLRALAGKTQFSASFLSQLELGQSSPSLASLQRICVALALDLADLLRDSARPSAHPVLRRAARKPFRSAWSRASAESLLPSEADERLRATLISLDRGGNTGTIQRRRGAREFAYCIRGKITLVADGKRLLLRSGDTVLLDSMREVSWENPGASRAQILVVAARPG